MNTIRWQENVKTYSVFLVCDFIIKCVDGLGFGEVLVLCTLQLAMSRNSNRTTPLPMNTIKNMADDLEPAQADKFHWEYNSITVDTLAVDNAWCVCVCLCLHMRAYVCVCICV